ncbi:MAG: DUF192 domain-containing protein [Candidatus Micrarchaeota archaeon]|nr:DUF192 domain-containing protein [Candidatus Micrarchaeota archaeon]
MEVRVGENKIDCLFANNFFSRLRGLMFRPSAIPILFEFPSQSTRRNAIHSLFVLFPFDAIFLNERKEAADIFESIPPFKLWIEPKNPPKYLIELPAGSVGKFKIKKGTRFEF